MSSDTGYYRKKDNQVEYIQIRLVDEEGEEFDMEHLRNIFKDTIDSQKEKLEKIVDFGTAILGDHYKGVSFMFGWVVQKIINAYEQKNGVKLKILTEIEALEQDEIKAKTVDILEDLLNKIKNDEIDLEDMPLNFNGVEYD